MSEHHYTLTRADRRDLILWLKGPNGSLGIGDCVIFEAGEGGGVRVLTKPW